MPYDGGELQFVVEIQINGVWITITSRARKAGGLWLKHARSEGAIQAETSRCRITIGNDDGWLTEGNPMSSWYPHIGRGTPIRILLAGILAADAALFTGKIDTLQAEFPSDRHCVTVVEAIGQLGEIAQSNDSLQSAHTRAILRSPTPPLAWWHLEDHERSTVAASLIDGVQPMRPITSVNYSLPGGQPIPPGGAPSFAAGVGPAGSDKLVSLTNGGTLEGTIPQAAVATEWSMEFVVKWDPGTSLSTEDVAIVLADGTYGAFIINAAIGAPGFFRGITIFHAVDRNASNSGRARAEFNPADGAAHHIRYTVAQDGANYRAKIYLDGVLKETADNFGSPMTGTVGQPRRIEVNPISESGDVMPSAIGQITFWRSETPPIDTVTAAFGHIGEQAGDRVDRLCDEEGFTAAILGDSSAAMGPQRVAALFDLLLDCERADQGMLFDAIDSLAITYRTRQNLYTQMPQIAVKRESLTPDLKPVWDFQRVRNDWTLSREGGGTARVSDEDHVTASGRRAKDSLTVNLDSDNVLADHASFRVAIGTAPGPRYMEGGINLRNNEGAKLADAVLGLRPGDRFTAAAEALPSQHPPGGFDQMVIGWEAGLDAYEWLLYPNMIPGHPWNVIGRWDSEGSVLHTALTSTGTSADVATTDGPLWTTDVGGGFDWDIDGEQVRVTAIAASLVTFGATGTAAHANNANVTPSLPASVAEGNLLLILAAIRNSGSGVPQAPTGYTRLAVFPTTSNVQLFAKIATASESAPTVTFTGGAANADTSAQMIRLAGKWHDVANIIPEGGAAHCLNASAQNITYPGLSKPEADNCIILYLGWKQDDWTSVATIAGATEIGEPSTITGDDQGIVWDYVIQTSRAAVAAGVFTVTGGATAISRGAVVALRCDYQTATIERSLNGVVKAHSAGASVSLWQPMRWGL